MKFLLFPIVLLCFLTACNNGEKQNQATLVLTNARIWTGNPSQEWAEALAVQGDSLIFIGNTEGVKNFIQPTTKVIDAKGQMVTHVSLILKLDFTN